ncbi:TonB-dependent receptor [Tsuneonella sp. HG249]
MRRIRMRAAHSVLLAGCAAVPTGAAAQERTAHAPSEIVVTAMRESEPLATVAAPVSVVSGATVRDAAITTADRLAEFSTALTVLPNPTANIIFLRGVGNFTLTPSTDPAVGWNYDGVFVARPNATQGQFFDLERVEILKGPQGVLYGRNASAGTINLIPVHPQPGRTDGYAIASYGTHDTLNFEAAANLSLGVSGALRISGQALAQDSLLSGFAEGASQQSARMQLQAELRPGLTVRVASDFMQQGGVGAGTTYLGYYAFDAAAGRFRLVPSNLAIGIGNRDAAAQAFRQTVPLPSLGRNLDAQAAVPYQNNEIYGAHAEVTAELGFATLTVLPAWRRNDFDQIAAGAPFGYLFQEHDDQLSIEARLTGSAGPLKWLAGGLLSDENIRARYTTNFSTQLGISDTRYATRSRALFANGTLSLVSGLRLVAGARRSWDEKSISGSSISFNLACPVRVAGQPSCPSVPLLQLGPDPSTGGLPVPVVGMPLPILVAGAPTGATISRTDRADGRRSAHFGLTTWRAGVEADIALDGVAYADIQTGYRPGGLNSATGFETYAPERVTSYTVGARWRERRLAITGELFWWDYRDQHVSSVQPDLSSPPRNVNFTRNAARSRIRGMAVEATFRPASGSTLFTDVQYLDSKYLDFDFVQVSTGNPPLTGCAATLTATANRYSVDCSGKRPFASPRWTMHIGARQRLSLGGADLEFMARTRYVSAQNVGATLLDEQIIGAHWTSDAQVQFHPRGERFEIAAFVRNISGERYPNFVIFHPTSNLLVSSVSPPRVVGLRVGAKF